MNNIYKSKINRRFREACNGFDLSQFSMLTETQFLDMLDRLNLVPGERVLDLGCGLGRIAHELYLRTDVEMVGIDIAEEFIKLGREEFGDEIELLEMDYESLSFPIKSFDCIYCVDSLYFSKDLEGVILNIIELLKEGGRFCVFWSQLQEKGEDPNILEANRTRLGAVLEKNGIRYNSYCYTSEELEFWKKLSSALKEFENEFREEGFDEFVDVIGKECANTLEYVNEQRTSRFMYLIEQAGGAKSTC